MNKAIKRFFVFGSLTIVTTTPLFLSSCSGYLLRINVMERKEIIDIKDVYSYISNEIKYRFLDKRKYVTSEFKKEISQTGTIYRFLKTVNLQKITINLPFNYFNNSSTISPYENIQIVNNIQWIKFNNNPIYNGNNYDFSIPITSKVNNKVIDGEMIIQPYVPSIDCISSYRINIKNIYKENKSSIVASQIFHEYVDSWINNSLFERVTPLYMKHNGGLLGYNVLIRLYENPNAYGNQSSKWVYNLIPAFIPLKNGNHYTFITNIKR